MAKKIKHPEALRSRALKKPTLNKNQGLKAYRTGKASSGRRTKA